ncbi:6513_t:CDS:2, partial [Dentiscutata heterogama]
EISSIRKGIEASESELNKTKLDPELIHDEAKFYCGYYLHGGSKYGVPKNDDVAIVYLQQAADAGIVEAQTYCAKIYLYSIDDSDMFNGRKWQQFGQEIDKMSAIKYWKKVEKKGSIIAKGRLGMFDE